MGLLRDQEVGGSNPLAPIFPNSRGTGLERPDYYREGLPIHYPLAPIYPNSCGTGLERPDYYREGPPIHYPLAPIFTRS